MRPILTAPDREQVVCSVCKGSLNWQSSVATCPTCALDFPSVEETWDFRIKRPKFLDQVIQEWAHGQDEYERWTDTLAETYEGYCREIDSVREIYTEEFKLTGSVLDVGGNDGRLRHFLDPQVRYLAVDPFMDAFKYVQKRPDLRKAYPRLEEPCPFLCAVAEHLPLRAATFDCVHMRSVIDHFSDPLRALLEARRVLVDAGRVLIGIHVTGAQSPFSDNTSRIGSVIERIKFKVEREGVTKAVVDGARRIVGRGEDAHIWHPTYDELLELLKFTKFKVLKEHWQKPPNNHVIYVLAEKSKHAGA